MGCGASAPVATLENMEEMAVVSVKECCALCAQHALDGVKNKELPIAIKAPTNEIKSVRELPDQLKDAAKTAKDEAGKAGDDVAEQLKESAKGGMFAGLASAVGSATQAVTGVVGSGASSVLTGMADAVQAGVDKLDGEFAKVGQELCEKERQAIVDAFNKVINEAQFKKCIDMIRGKEPYGETEYNDCAKDSCSKAFMATTASILVPQLLKVESVKEAIQKSGCVSAWKSLIENCNKATGKLAEVTGSGERAPIDLDIEVYIATQLVQELATIMGKREGEIRAKPADLSKIRPRTFPLLFSGNRIMKSDYNNFQQNI